VARETNIFSEKGQKVLLGLDLAPREKKLLEALLKTYRHLETRIGESKAFVEKLYEESREAQFIRTIPGFGKYLSVLVAVEIADLTRFTDAAHLHAYAGVIPSIHSSGDRTHPASSTARRRGTRPEDRRARRRGGPGWREGSRRRKRGRGGRCAWTGPIIPKYSTNFSTTEKMAPGGAIMAGGTTGGAIFYRLSRRSWIW
jgi:transposase